MNNLSLYADELTASTSVDCATQRAENMSILGVRSVLELCVGPSLSVLSAEYSRFGIRTIGNDIDSRWLKHAAHMSWRIGDCLSIGWDGADAVVFAPPLSKGCSGKREDALSIDAVAPSYTSFVDRFKTENVGVGVLVLPARSLATQDDRRQLHSLLSRLNGFNASVVPLASRKRNIRKYVDVYVERRR